MGKYTLEIKLRMAYLNFVKKAAIVFSIWVLAFASGVSLIITSEFIYTGYIQLKIGAVIVALLLFTRILYDIWKDMKRESNEVGEQTPVYKG